MTGLETRQPVHPDHARQMDSAALRAHFLVGGLFAPGALRLVQTHHDRLILATAVPEGGALVLDHVAALRTPGFLDRREMGIVALADRGRVQAGGVDYPMARGDVLYLGCGTGPVRFEAGRFYLVSAPAHRPCPARLIARDQARRVDLGAEDTANRRTIRQFLHPEVHPTCQLSLGYTELAPGSVWNTMPPHTHDRRTEVYLYHDMAPEARVLHLMGEPEQTRHLWVANEEAVISPPWSIHAGAGLGRYGFIWAMAGENQDFTDMDPVAAEDLR